MEMYLEKSLRFVMLFLLLLEGKNVFANRPVRWNIQVKKVLMYLLMM